MLEYTQRYFSRLIQGFSSSLLSISNFRLWTIQGYIDKYRLPFLITLHRSDQTSQHNQVYYVNSDIEFYSKIHTKLSPNMLWIFAKEDPFNRLFKNFSTSFLYKNS